MVTTGINSNNNTKTDHANVKSGPIILKSKPQANARDGG
jgi:hypothetical protein